eukprot:9189065-Pyramimonas_sp.AAC.1
MYSPAHSLQKRVLTAYSEVVACAVRQGAPVSSYATHRRSLQAYAETVTQDKVASPICFMCGCSFPWVPGRKNNDISWGRVFESDARDGSGLTHLGAWSMWE